LTCQWIFVFVWLPCSGNLSAPLATSHHSNRKPHVLAPFDDGSVAMACQYMGVNCTSVIDDDAKWVNTHYTKTIQYLSFFCLSLSLSLCLCLSVSLSLCLPSLSNQVTARSAVARLSQMVRGDNKAITYKELPPISCLGMLGLPFGHALSNCPADLHHHWQTGKRAAQYYDKVLTFNFSIDFHVCRVLWCSRSAANLVSHRVSCLR
jgi:hypothetical protein